MNPKFQKKYDKIQEYDFSIHRKPQNDIWVPTKGNGVQRVHTHGHDLKLNRLNSKDLQSSPKKNPTNMPKGHVDSFDHGGYTNDISKKDVMIVNANYDRQNPGNTFQDLTKANFNKSESTFAKHWRTCLPAAEKRALEHGKPARPQTATCEKYNIRLEKDPVTNFFLIRKGNFWR